MKKSKLTRLVVYLGEGDKPLLDTLKKDAKGMPDEQWVKRPK